MGCGRMFNVEVISKH